MRTVDLDPEPRVSSASSVEQETAGHPSFDVSHEVARLAASILAGAPSAWPSGAAPSFTEAAPPIDLPGSAPRGLDASSAADLPYYLTLSGAPASPSTVTNLATPPGFGAPSPVVPLVVPEHVAPNEPQSATATPYFLEIAGPPPDVDVPKERDVAFGRSNVDRPPTNRPESGLFDPEVSAASTTPEVFDPNAVRRDFPILEERVRGRRLVWLDNAATTQKPRAVIDRLSYFYEHENSNVHRAAHTLAARATDAYEGARDKVRRFLGAPSARDIVFARGATEAINLVAQSWGRRHVGAGDEIVITWLEHHANIVPWQMLCREKGAKLRVAPVDSRGQVILEEYERLLGPRTRIVSLSHVSNALGTIVPIEPMIEMAHRHGACVLVDGAQAVSHLPVDVQTLGCEFYVFSGHKVFAPTGIGALFGKAEVLEQMPPWQGGGNMIADVTFEATRYQAAPWRFEAGTGSIADAVGLGAALDYLTSLGLPNVSRYEHELRVYAEEQLVTVPGLRIIGTAPDKAGVISFVIDGVRTEDVGGALDQEGIAVRSGHHCAQPILRRFGLEATVRASFAPYNTKDDVDALVSAVRRLQVGRVN